ncbi:MAG: hypothetical protein KME01_06125 [Chroococcus sp. CMT-3BRIN-NPC107]|nr:hypothetical protein [Chroococcus sp. CMT-3BRIN-NPC107]
MSAVYLPLALFGEWRQLILLPIAAYRRKPFFPSGGVFGYMRTCSFVWII